MDFNTGSSGSGSPRNSGRGAGSGMGSGGAPPRAPSGADFDYRNLVPSFISTTRQALLQPAGFFRSINKSGDWINPILFAIIWYEIAAVLGGLIGLIFGSVSSLGSGGAGEQAAGVATSFGVFIVGLIVAPFIAAIILFVMAGLRHVLILLFVGQNAGFEATLRVQAYTFSTRIVWWIPILGPLVGFVYGLFLSVVGIRDVHGTTTGKAALVVLIPGAVVFVLVAILAALFGAVILTWIFTSYTLIQQQM